MAATDLWRGVKPRGQKAGVDGGLGRENQGSDSAEEPVAATEIEGSDGSQGKPPAGEIQGSLGSVHLLAGQGGCPAFAGAVLAARRTERPPGPSGPSHKAIGQQTGGTAHSDHEPSAQKGAAITRITLPAAPPPT